MVASGRRGEVLHAFAQRHDLAGSEVVDGDDAARDPEEGSVAAVFGHPDRAADRGRAVVALGPVVALAAAPEPVLLRARGARTARGGLRATEVRVEVEHRDRLPLRRL